MSGVPLPLAANIRANGGSVMRRGAMSRRAKSSSAKGQFSHGRC